MAGIMFYFEKNDIDVWSGRRIDLDVWNYAEQAAGDIDRVIVINKTEENLQITNHYEVMTQEPKLSGVIAHVCCPWDIAKHKISLWNFDHKADWYLFGPANGWNKKEIDLGIYIPMASTGALHSIHVASIVLTHRYGVLSSWR